MNRGNSRLRPADLVSLGVHGLRVHPMRAVLSALGIAIGIAAMVAAIGISTSSQALIREKLDSLGTNLLTVTAGKDFTGNKTSLDPEAIDRIKRISGVEAASWTAALTDVRIYRNAEVSPDITGALDVIAVDKELLVTTDSTLLSGSWLNRATAAYPVTVLGRTAAERLGIRSPGGLVWIGGNEFTVGGILERSPLAPEIDTTAIIGADIAAQLFGFTGHPTTIYEVSSETTVPQVRALLPPTVSPQEPGSVEVSRPSDALSAANTIDQAFTGLLVGVSSIALLVGGIGIANTMVITVLERRREIGLRRALGATSSHIRAQFLVEAILLAAYGGVAGTILGWLITAILARSNGWLVAIPALLPITAIVVTILVGAVAGVIPAIRAARTSPTVALSA